MLTNETTHSHLTISLVRLKKKTGSSEVSSMPIALLPEVDDNGNLFIVQVVSWWRYKLCFYQAKLTIINGMITNLAFWEMGKQALNSWKIFYIEPRSEDWCNTNVQICDLITSVCPHCKASHIFSAHHQQQWRTIRSQLPPMHITALQCICLKSLLFLPCNQLPTVIYGSLLGMEDEWESFNRVHRT